MTQMLPNSDQGVEALPAPKSAKPVVEVRSGAHVILAASEFGVSQLDELRKFCAVSRVSEGYELSRPARNYNVGAVKGRSITVVFPPQGIDVKTVAGMVLYVAGTDRLLHARMDIELRTAGNVDLLAVALSTLLVAEAERVLDRHLAQGYSPRTEALQTIRGRPLFTASYLRVATGQLVCRHYVRETDVPANRLLLAGVSRAVGILPSGEVKRRARRTMHVLLDLAQEPRQPRPYHYDGVLSSLTRQTDHYSAALKLSKALLFGYTESDDASLATAAPRYNLAVLYEEYLSKLLIDGAPSFGLRAQLQEVDAEAFLDGHGKTYRKIRPDILLWRGSQLRAIIDAKYKASYVSIERSLGSAKRVSNADLYQSFFYNQRLSRLHQPILPVRSAIVAPQARNSLSPDILLRSVHWRDAHGGIPLQVLACDLTRMVIESNAGAAPSSILAASPELYAFLNGL